MIAQEDNKVLLQNLGNCNSVPFQFQLIETEKAGVYPNFVRLFREIPVYSTWRSIFEMESAPCYGDKTERYVLDKGAPGMMGRRSIFDLLKLTTGTNLHSVLPLYS